MNLAVDIGNTHIHLAWFAEEKIVHEFRLATSPLRTRDELVFWLEHAHHKAVTQHKQPRHITICSVVPDLLPLFEQALECLWGTEPLIITSALVESLGLQVKTDKPEEVGADRMVNAYAAWQEEQSPAVIIDFGTATTFDVLDETGAYCGGVIAPGINLSVEALYKAAARLPNVPVVPSRTVIGKNTVSAMQSGVYYGYQGLIRHITKGICTEMVPQKPRILATGGLAGLFAKESDVIQQHKPQLTMEGLRLITEVCRES